MSTLRVDAVTSRAGGKSKRLNALLPASRANFSMVTGAFRESVNASGLVDNGVGDFTVRYANALDNTGYSVVYGGQYDELASGANNDTSILSNKRVPNAMTVGSTRVASQMNSNTSGGGLDFVIACVLAVGGVGGMSKIIATTLKGRDGARELEVDKVIRGSAKAWFNSKGNGTVTIRNSLNTSGMTDVGVGLYDYALASAMSASDYSVNFSVSSGSATVWCNSRSVVLNPMILQAFCFVQSTNAYLDPENYMGSVEGDLAA